MNLHNVEFIKSVASEKDIMRETLPQIVFSGKSNVGKSSVINKLLGRKQFARVSSVPGKTVHINYFLVDKTAYFVDLPGYGYAKVAKAEYIRWSKLMESFFSSAKHITLGVMIVDARHEPTANDVTMAQWFKGACCRFVVVANKIDKVKPGELERNADVIRRSLELPDTTQLIMFSAQNGTGKNTLISVIEESVDIELAK